MATLQPLTPPLADAIVRKCLAKNAGDRWQSAADLASALRWAVDGTKASVPAAPQTVWRRPSVVGALAALTGVALATGVLFGWRYASSGTAPAPTVRFEVLPPAGVTLRPSPVASAAQLALSPDGRHLAFIAATKGGPSQIWIRPLDSVQAQPLAGTEGASFPFWSPDSRFIAFFAAGKLKKVDTRGGTPQTLADAAAGSRRDLEPGRRDRVHSPGEQSDFQNLCVGRDGHARHDVRCRSGDLHAVLATVSAGRPPFPVLPAQREGRAPGDLRDDARLLAEHAGPRNRRAGPSTRQDTCCSCATEYSSLRRSMTVRCGQAANRFVLRMASVTGQARSRIRPSPRRAPASWLTARAWCSRPAFVGMIGPERLLDCLSLRVRTDRRACRPIKRASWWPSPMRPRRSPISGCSRWPVAQPHA